MKKAYLFALALLVSCAQIEAQEYAVEELLETASYIEVNKIVKQ